MVTKSLHGYWHGGLSVVPPTLCNPDPGRETSESVFSFVRRSNGNKRQQQQQQQQQRKTNQRRRHSFDHLSHPLFCTTGHPSLFHTSLLQALVAFYLSRRQVLQEYPILRQISNRTRAQQKQLLASVHAIKSLDCNRSQEE